MQSYKAHEEDCTVWAQVVEERATEAEEEQLKTEQQLLAARADLAAAQDTPAGMDTTEQQQQLADLHEQLHAFQSRANELQTKLASAELQLTASQQSANSRGLPSEQTSRSTMQGVGSSQLKLYSSGSLPDAQAEATQPEQVSMPKIL